MKMLEEAEIIRLCEETKQEASDIICSYEQKIEKQYAAIKEEREHMYQLSLQLFHQQLEQYEASLKQYEDNIAKEEIEYPKRVQAWKEQEKRRKEQFDRIYEQSIVAFERVKSSHEAAGLPFDAPPPQKGVFFPTPEPQKRTYSKPFRPNPPQNPENTDFSDWRFLSSSLTAGMMLSSRVSPDVWHQLIRIDLSDPQKRDDAIHLLLHDLYIKKRKSMECSALEGAGKSPVLDGLYGEKLTVFELELCIYYGLKGRILHNLEIVVSNKAKHLTKTIQVDVLFITSKGIFVIESKHYSGSVSGTESDSNWKLRIGRKDYHFYNPVTQNQTHINVLSRIIPNTKFFSLIAFSNKCTLEYIDIHRQNVFVFNRHAMRDVLTDLLTTEPDVLPLQNIGTAANVLQRYCADDPIANPDYKEIRSYYSARSKVDNSTSIPFDTWHSSYKRRPSYRKKFYSRFDDDDYDEDYLDDDYDDDD